MEMIKLLEHTYRSIRGLRCPFLQKAHLSHSPSLLPLDRRRPAIIKVITPTIWSVVYLLAAVTPDISNWPSHGQFSQLLWEYRWNLDIFICFSVFSWMRSKGYPAKNKASFCWSWQLIIQLSSVFHKWDTFIAEAIATEGRNLLCLSDHRHEEALRVQITLC